MDYTTLGNTGLRVSVMGLGCGGPSRLGQNYGQSEDDSVRVARAALDAGVNIIDTAEAYRTEPFVGAALRDVPRDSVVISTKKSVRGQETPADVRTSLEASLQRLGTDFVDIYHMHGVLPEEYAHVRENLVPTLLQLRDEGKIRFLGITEAFETDSGHDALRMALEDDCWQVMMVGLNLLNQSARERVLSQTQAKGIGTLIMFAVRRALSRPERLREVLDDLLERGKVSDPALRADDPLGFLVTDGVVGSLPEAAYRFCRYEPGCDVILSGTGRVDHLHENVASLLQPDLPSAIRTRLAELFSSVDDISGS